MSTALPCDAKSKALQTPLFFFIAILLWQAVKKLNCLPTLHIHIPASVRLKLQKSHLLNISRRSFTRQICIYVILKEESLLKEFSLPILWVYILRSFIVFLIRLQLCCLIYFRLYFYIQKEEKALNKLQNKTFRISN